MTSLYCTADIISATTGGGVVTRNESRALKELGPCEIWGRDSLDSDGPDPWKWDDVAEFKLSCAFTSFELAHFYSGTFSQTVKALKETGCKVAYTVAAHSIEISKREHESLGIPYDLPHLTDPELFHRYSEGYALADVVICPSQHSASVMRNYGFDNVVVIPHGVDIHSRPPAPLPRTFTVGYLGAIGPDKGLKYLLAAWKQLKYKDAVLRIAGRESTSQFMKELIHHFGGGNIELVGWVDNVSDFYDSISLYVQPSASEGFGIEVLEAMAHPRAVLCSTGAGAVDIVGSEHQRFTSCDVEELASLIDNAKIIYHLTDYGQQNSELAKQYDWKIIRKKYQDVWKGLLK